MLITSTILTYPVLTILSIGKKSFANMGLLINKCGYSVKRLLNPAQYSLYESKKIAKTIFLKNKVLYVGIDDTLIRKIHSKFMVGAGMFFDTKISRSVMSYRLAIGIITDGKFAIPIDCAYFFAKEILLSIKEKFPSKDEIAKAFVKAAIKLFPDKKIIVVVDGLYSTVEFVKWCKLENICLEARMHSNRVVEFNGKKIKIKDLLLKKGICPEGRQMARTISVIWHSIDLELTIVRRFDKKDRESIVFQIATYKALPREHVANYKKRWLIEMLNRTTKQRLGLQDCFSLEFETQHNHVAAVLLAYSLAQLERQKFKLNNVEDALRKLEKKSADFLINRFTRFSQDNLHFDA